MKKIFFMVLMFFLLINLTACDKKEEFSIDNNNIYFVKINGQKYKVGDKISKLENAGLSWNGSGLNQNLPSNRYTLSYGVRNSDSKVVLEVIPLNPYDHDIIIKDAVIGGIVLGDVIYDEIPEEILKLDAEVYGGIKLGSTYEDVYSVFGTETHKYESTGNGSVQPYTVYTYQHIYKAYKFYIDKNGKVIQIEWNDYDYDRK